MSFSKVGKSINVAFNRDAFRMFDRNMDGYIDMSELRKMFAMVGVGDGGVFSRDEMEEFMEEADRVSGKWSVSVDQWTIFSTEILQVIILSGWKWKT